jgi:hypothetical protein
LSAVDDGTAGVRVGAAGREQDIMGPGGDRSVGAVRRPAHVGKVLGHREAHLFVGDFSGDRGVQP